MNIKVYIALTFGFLVIGLAACSTATPSPSPVPTDTFVPASTYTPTPTATATFTPTPTATITPEPTPLGGGGKLVFLWGDYDKKIYPDLAGHNIFISDSDGANPVPLTTKGLDGTNIMLGDTSPDSSKIIAYSYYYTGKNPNFYNLYVVDLAGKETDPLKITQYAKGDLYYTNGISKWVNNDQIVFMGMVGGVEGLYLTDLKGSNPLLLTEGRNPLYVLSEGDGGINWFDYLGTDPQGIWWSSLDGAVQKQIVNFDDNIRYIYATSPDGGMVVWTTFIYNSGFITVSPLDDTYNSTSIPFPAPLDYFEPIWSPDGSKIFFKEGGTYEPTTSYIADLKSCAFISLPALPTRDDGFKEELSSAVWSPDSQRLIMKSFCPASKCVSYMNINRVFDLASNTYVATLPEEGAYDVVWIPEPNQPEAVYDPESAEARSLCTYQAKLPDGQFRIRADKKWKDTLVVFPGDVVTVEYLSGKWGWGGGEVSLDAQGDSKYKGADVPHLKCKIAKACISDAPMGILIGKLGERGEPFVIGNSKTFTIPADAPKNQSLYLMINDNLQYISDNQGSILVNISVK